MGAADDAPNHGADDDDDERDDEEDAPARAVPRYPRDDGLVAVRRRFVLAGVADRTGAVAHRGRPVLVVVCG